MPTPVHLRGDPILRRLPRGPAIAVEVGVFVATLSQYLLSKHRFLRLIAVDSWAPQARQPEAYQATGDRHAAMTSQQCTAARLSAHNKLSQYRGRVNVLAMPSVEAARRVRDWSCDLVFLDGDHSEAGVTADLEAWEMKIRPGGYLGGHDFENPRPRYKFGVDEAVRKFVEGTSLQVERDSDGTWFCRL
jgi:hypothetical protein